MKNLLTKIRAIDTSNFFLFVLFSGLVSTTFGTLYLNIIYEKSIESGLLLYSRIHSGIELIIISAVMHIFIGLLMIKKKK